jgi:uncharacterized damage-inducible protein DinB
MRHAALAVVLLLLVAGVRAQQTPAPPATGQSASADPLLADLIRDWEAQKSRLVAIAEAMPAEKYEFKATPEQRTFAEQLLHLAEAHVSMLKALDSAGKTPAPTLSKSHAPKDVAQSLAAAYDYGSALLNSLDGPAHQSSGRSTRARVVWAAMNNAMNHYGQCVVYLRLNGIVPPASRK